MTHPDPVNRDVNAPHAQIGILGNNTKVEGGIHFHQHGEYTPAGKPLQRPRRAEYFTGREEELAWLLAELRPGKVVTLCGPGGMGKSALAAEALWTLAPGDEPPELFPDGIVAHSFYGRPGTALALEHLVRSFDPNAQDTTAAAAQRLLAGKQALVLLDGTEEAEDLRAVLDLLSSCGILVTSRKRGDAVATRKDLPPLAEGQAMGLLRAWGRGQVADPTAAARICELIGRLPLTVRLVGRYLEQTGETAAEYLEWLEETPIEALSPGEHREDNVALLLEHGLAQVSETARQVLATAGLLALASFDRGVIVAALDMSRGEVRRALNQLASYGLLRREGDRFEVSHALIHTYTRRRLAASNEIAHRVVEYYTNLAKEQSKLGPEGYARLDAERAHFMSVLRDCITREDWEVGRSLARVIGRFDGYLAKQCHRNEQLTAIELGLVASRALGDRQTEGAGLGDLGDIRRNLGEVARAIEYYEQALTIAREIGNRSDEAATLSRLGFTYHHMLGQIERAIQYHDLSLTIAREIGNQGTVSINLDNLGKAYHALGQVKRAIQYHQQALTIARENNYWQYQCNALSSLGNTYQDLGQMERAIEYYEQALTIARKIGSRHSESIDLGNLGTVYRVLGQVHKAIEYYQQALAIVRETGHRSSEGTWLGNLGLAYRTLGQMAQAKQYWQQALAIYEEIKSTNAEKVCQWLAELEARETTNGE